MFRSPIMFGKLYYWNYSAVRGLQIISSRAAWWSTLS